MTPPDELAPDFDASLLANSESSLPRPDFQAFIEDYLTGMTDRLQRADALAAANDIAALGREAHILISTSGSYGFRRASLLARQLEAACKTGNAAHAGALLRELSESVRQACVAMRARFLASAN